MMGTRIKSFKGMLGLLVLLAANGCASTGGNPFAWLTPKTKQDQAVEQLMAAKKSKVSPAKQSSIYPPEVIQSSSIPKTEKDLKKPTQLHLSYAKLQEQLGYFKEARSSYEKVISKEPQSVEANIGLGRLEAMAGHYEQAEKQFRNAIAIAPKSPEALFAYGKFLATQQRYTEAIVEMQKAVQQSPANNTYKFEIGLTLARAGQLEESYVALSELVGHAEAYYNIGYIALKERKDPATAQRYFQQALVVNPELKQARYWLTELNNSRQANILAASATQQAKEQNQVHHALNVQPASQRYSESLIPTTAPNPGEIPENLTPAQREQWKNQSGMQ